MVGPISDLTVLDLSHGICGPYATKLLADYGANVIKVEPPKGDLSRAVGPFPGDVSHPEKSGTFAFLNTNKRSIVLDLKKPGARDVLANLIKGADVVVESFAPGTLEKLGAGWDFIHGVKPSVPLVSITNFGQVSPYKDYKGTEVVLYGFGGEMYTMGIASREPVKMYGTAALVESGAAAAAATMGAMMVGVGQGIGQHVDFSIVDSQLAGNDRRHASAIAYEYSGKKSFRTGGGGGSLAEGTYPCADGWVEFTAASQRMDRLADMLGKPDWLADPKWYTPMAALNPALIEEFSGHFYGWLSERTKREIWQEARRAKVLCGPLFTVAELREDPHFVPRKFFVTMDHPELGSIEIPGRPFIMPESPWELRRPAPLLAQHTGELLAEAGYSAGEIAQLASSGVVEVRK